MKVLRYLAKTVVSAEQAPLFIDGCAGFGGHSVAILDFVPSSKLLCIDRDPSVPVV